MNQDEFVKQFDLVNAWVNTMRPHWRHLNGDVHNDKDFWQQCIHGVKPDVWSAWVSIFHTLEESCPTAFAGHSYIGDDTEAIYVRTCGNKRMTIPYNKTGYNKPIFRAAMAIKDIMADITERPFETQPVWTKERVKTKPTKDQVMAEFERLQVMVKDLFD